MSMLEKYSESHSIFDLWAVVEDPESIFSECDGHILEKVKSGGVSEEFVGTTRFAMGKRDLSEFRVSKLLLNLLIFYDCMSVTANQCKISY